ncbi:glutathione binding-like protein [Brevundimonas sp. G8]|uniref:glutathione binding-like protein n=1 Tax=Brevundimonas sp. G8 TaxID=1350776 RepID=UPI0012F0E3A2|nr:glutathione binding-like protein [Brevundimonas sp. G8]VXB67356.1 Glutathione S-transferase [Brevundimonas sp. G8]
MKLYYSPVACSLADHIALREAGFTFDLERVDLKTHRTETGRDFREISAKAYVPVLVMDDGDIITENVAVLDWIATTGPTLTVEGALGRTRVLEALTFITTEIHHAFKPMWHGGSVDERENASAKITTLFNHLGPSLKGDYLFGDRPSVADFYLFVMLLWAERFEVITPEPLQALRARMLARPAVRAAMVYEGLLLEGGAST